MTKASLLRFFHRLGYRLERQAGPVDVRAAGNDPRQWLGHPVRGVLMAAPRTGGRIRFFPLEPGTNPFVRAAAEALAADDPGGAIRSVLGRHYEAVQPRRLQDWAGLEDAEAPGLPEAPVWAVPEPWTPATLAQKTAAMEGVARRGSRGLGREKRFDRILDGAGTPASSGGGPERGGRGRTAWTIRHISRRRIRQTNWRP